MVFQKYRKDIDGLRALAVIPVVLFHLGFEGMSGGFVGVDIFFVISGYLITGIVCSEIENNKFSFLSFYERRARRLLPAYFLVAISVMLLGWFYLLPIEFEWAAEGLLASTFFVSNIYFWRHSGYFSLEAEYSPFLHTWSLSVEEQFYLFFPLIVLLSYRVWGRKGTLVSSLTVLVISLLISEFGKVLSQSATFYLIFTRAWELLVGALLAMNSHRVGVLMRQNNMVPFLLSVAGFLCIIISVVFYDSSTSFPGVAAIVPVLGGTFLIASGMVRNLGSRILEIKPVVWVGTISYSLYLWHWPVIVYGRHFFGEDFSMLERILLLILSFLLAYITTNTVEKYFRQRTCAKSKIAMWRFGLSGIVLLAVMGLAVTLNGGIPSRYPSDVLEISERINDFSPNRADCHVKKLYSIRYEDKCVFGADDVNPSYAFWGDSHAMEISDALGEIAEGYGKSGLHISYSSCPPAQGFSWERRPYCGEHNRDVLTGLLADDDINVVFLIARYNSYSRTELMANEMLSGIEKTVVGLVNGGKKVVLLEPIPRYPGIVPLEVARTIAHGGSDSFPRIKRERYTKDNVDVLLRLQQISDQHGAILFSPQNYFCDQEYCNFQNQDLTMLFDDDHLSMSASRVISKDLYRYVDQGR